jgi:hypothetical protein
LKGFDRRWHIGLQTRHCNRYSVITGQINFLRHVSKPFPGNAEMRPHNLEGDSLDEDTPYPENPTIRQAGDNPGHVRPGHPLKQKMGAVCCWYGGFAETAVLIPGEKPLK